MTNSTILFYAETPEAESWFDQLADTLLAADINLVMPIPAAGKPFATWLHQVRSRNGIKPQALLYLGNLTGENLTTICKSAGMPVLFSGQWGHDFQIGPAVIWGKTACPSCWKQQKTFFPLSTPTNGTAGSVFTPNLLEELAPPLTSAVQAYITNNGSAFLRQGYQQRFNPENGRIQIYRLLKSPFCDDCSVYSHYPSEIIYI